MRDESTVDPNSNTTHVSSFGFIQTLRTKLEDIFNINSIEATNTENSAAKVAASGLTIIQDIGK